MGQSRPTDARHRPVSTPAQGTPVILCSVSPEGTCGTTGRKPRPRRPHVSMQAPVCKSTRAVTGSASNVAPRQRSAREWVFQFAACPRGVTSADTDPFVRAVARTCTWTVRPFCRRLSPYSLGISAGLSGPISSASGARPRGGPPASSSTLRRRSRRAPCRNWTRNNYSYGGQNQLRKMRNRNKPVRNLCAS